MNCKYIRFISDEEYLDSTLTTANLGAVNWSQENEKKRTRGSRRVVKNIKLYIPA